MNSMNSHHGTADDYTLGQFATITAGVVTALPMALQGVPYKQAWAVVKKGEELEQALARIFRDQAFGLSPFSRDMTKKGWEVLEDVGGESIPVSSLELLPFLKDGEEYIKGEEMVRRAREEVRANLGQRQAEYLLEHQEEIPREWQDYYLLFPGTIWRDRHGYRYFPCLYWGGVRWYLGFDWLGLDFYRYGRLLRPCESNRC